MVATLCSHIPSTMVATLSKDPHPIQKSCYSMQRAMPHPQELLLYARAMPHPKELLLYARAMPHPQWLLFYAKSHVPSTRVATLHTEPKPYLEWHPHPHVLQLYIPSHAITYLQSYWSFLPSASFAYSDYANCHMDRHDSSFLPLIFSVYFWSMVYSYYWNCYIVTQMIIKGNMK